MQSYQAQAVTIPSVGEKHHWPNTHSIVIDCCQSHSRYANGGVEGTSKSGV